MLFFAILVCLPGMQQVESKVDEQLPTHWLVAVHVAGVTHLGDNYLWIF